MAPSLAGNSWKSARSRAIAGSERRVTAALRSGSDAADVVRCPPFRLIVRADDVRHSIVLGPLFHRRKLGFEVEHIVQIAVERVGNTVRNFQGWHTLPALNGVQRLPADLDLPGKLSLRHVVVLNRLLSDSVQDRH